jgi:heme-degrading monooxygenase HmoA
MQSVVTTAKLKPGRAAAVAELFEATNPDLVRGEPDWLGARLMVDRETETVIVMALWRSARSYRRFSQSAAFREVMAGFAEHLDGPPEVRVTEVLVEMSREG